MLKSEIRRLYQDRQNVVKERVFDDKSTSVLERKYILVKEALEKLRSERHDIQKNNFDLKCRAEDMEKRYFDLKNQYQHFAEVSKRKATDFSEKPLVKASKPSWGSLGSTNARNSANPSGSRAENENLVVNSDSLSEIPDFEAWRLKLDSLKTERDFLKNENELAKNKIEEVYFS